MHRTRNNLFLVKKYQTKSLLSWTTEKTVSRETRAQAELELSGNEKWHLFIQFIRGRTGCITVCQPENAFQILQLKHRKVRLCLCVAPIGYLQVVCHSVIVPA